MRTELDSAAPQLFDRCSGRGSARPGTPGRSLVALKGVLACSDGSSRVLFAKGTLELVPCSLCSKKGRIWLVLPFRKDEALIADTSTLSLALTQH